MSCLDANAIAAFVGSRLSAEARSKVEAHVDKCRDCRRVLVELARAAGPALEATVVDGPKNRNQAAAAEPEATLRVSGQVVADRYELEHFLASGGMAEVWRAVDLQLDVPVAVKFLQADYARDEETLARFEREAKAAARLRSPHVVTIHGWGFDDDGSAYMAMELLEGEDLERRLTLRGRLSLAETEALLVQMARGLQRAHDLGIVHRDIKPSNVFLVPSDGEEIVKILDFGIAKTPMLALESLTGTGQVLGTIGYMSPEQAIGDRHIDHRSDLWSLGLIVYRMLTGSDGITGESVSEALDKIRAAAIPRPSHIAPDLPVALDGFCARTFALSRGQRFASARELAEAFSRIVADSRAAELADEPTTPNEPAVPATTGDRTVLVGDTRAPAAHPLRVLALAVAIAATGAVLAASLLSGRAVEPAAESEPIAPAVALPAPREPTSEPAPAPTATSTASAAAPARARSIGHAPKARPSAVAPEVPDFGY